MSPVKIMLNLRVRSDAEEIKALRLPSVQCRIEHHMLSSIVGHLNGSVIYLQHRLLLINHLFVWSGFIAIW